LLAASIVLTGCGSAQQPAETGATGEASADKGAASESSSAAQQAPPPDRFNEFTDTIKAKVPSWKEGGALVARFLVVQKNVRNSNIYIAKEGFTRTKKGGTALLAESDTDKGWLGIISKRVLGKGHYECQKDDVAVILNMNGSFEVADPETALTVNGDGNCEIDIYDGEIRGDLQGKFSGKLVTNSGDGFYLIEMGYFYLKGVPPRTPIRKGKGDPVLPY
jgi:hypothetical protein